MSIINPAKMHWQFIEVYGEGVMNEGNVFKWCHLFNGGKIDVHNEARSECPSVCFMTMHNHTLPEKK
jgi:hypothetical protein